MKGGRGESVSPFYLLVLPVRGQGLRNADRKRKKRVRKKEQIFGKCRGGDVRENSGGKNDSD